MASTKGTLIEEKPVIISSNIYYLLIISTLLQVSISTLYVSVLWNLTSLIYKILISHFSLEQTLVKRHRNANGILGIPMNLSEESITPSMDILMKIVY